MSDVETNEGATRPRADDGGGPAQQLRELFVFRAGARRFAVFREEVEATAENLRPAPLPFAPRAVLGVVALRGRVRTALDPLKLFAAPDETSSDSTQQPRLFVALAGDEQLALACDSAEESFTISTDELRPDADPDTPARGLVAHEASEVTVLDPSRLFDAAMRGRDRRRRRT
jgi:chemotaxis signal transduction protein